MQDILLEIQNDSTLMLSFGIAIVVLLVIVLVIVVASMRVKTYKDRFVSVRTNNDEKAEHIVSLEKELQEYKIKNASNEQELHHFYEAKEVLKKTRESLSITRKEFTDLEKEQSSLTTKFENIQSMHDNLLEEHKSLQKHTNQIQEEHSKLRINNARLLTKLETEAMFASRLNQRNSKKNMENESQKTTGE